MEGLEEWEKRLSQAIESQYPAEFREMVIDLAVQLQGKVKDNTPVKTGHLRNEWHVGSIEKRGNEYYIEVYNNVEYAEPGGIWTPGKRWKGLCKRSPHDGAFPSGSAETPSRLSPGVDE